MTFTQSKILGALFLLALGSASAQISTGKEELPASAVVPTGATAAEDLIATATPVFERAEQQLVGTATLSSGATIGRVGRWMGKLSVPVKEGSTLPLSVVGHVALVATGHLKFLGTPEENAGVMRPALKELGEPLAQACASLQGVVTHTFVAADGAPDAAALYRQPLSILARDKSTGLFTCAVNGQVAFAYTLALGPSEKQLWLPPAWDFQAYVQTYEPKAMVTQVAAASKRAEEFDRQSRELRQSGTGGTQVQVNRSALQSSQLGTPSTWICALLIERKEGLMQVQIGTNVMFVPSDQVVPRLNSVTALPGLPSACATLPARH